MAAEAEIHGYQIKNSFYVCPVCASDEEKGDSDTKEMRAEDVIHASVSPLECARCKKEIK